uniref:Xylanolytic transcriptional activator regulatory domain-containing protein n=1 Tax=Fusarium oxysporum (strain Fo5176) TaxID=660025 RepID=A0A0D2XXY0_FUSOF
MFLTHPCSALAQQFGRDDFKSVAAATRLPATSSPLNCDRLQREQQDALLDLYWQGYHAIYPVIDEATFRQHYDSLWSDNTKRQACPLVDIVIALCIQFGSSYTTCDNVVVPDQPGFDFYLQAQQALVQDLDYPSLQSAQCYFLSAIYLLALNKENSAYMMIRSAVAAAESLGLQLDGDNETQDTEGPTCAKTGSRLWRCLVTLDTQVSLHLGRPFAISEPHLYEREHPESDSIAQLAGPNFTISQSSGINWLRFQHERQGLFQVIREIHTELARVMENVLSEIDQPDFYQHPSSREKCAKYLYEQLKRLKAWVEKLPGSLKTPRLSRDSGILAGCFQVFDWQRTATFALAGFSCGYPICPMSPTARKTLTLAARVFEIFGSKAGVQLTNGLKIKCLELVEAFRARLGLTTPATTPASNQKSPETLDTVVEPSSYQIMSVGGLLWGDLLKDLDSGLVSSLGQVGVDD